LKEKTGLKETTGLRETTGFFGGIVVGCLGRRGLK
jgi:hypothetical protein